MCEDSTEPDVNESLYAELHEIASRALMGEYRGHSLQPTILVHDAYLRLQKQRNLGGAQRHEILAAGATIIRSLLVDYARKRKAKKRGGNEGRGESMHLSIAEQKRPFDLVELHETLNKLEQQHARSARVVNCVSLEG